MTEEQYTISLLESISEAVNGSPMLADKRDLFAAMLMSECIKVMHDKHFRDPEPVLLSIMIDEAAQVAVKAADRLIAELAK